MLIAKILIPALLGTALFQYSGVVQAQTGTTNSLAPSSDPDAPATPRYFPTHPSDAPALNDANATNAHHSVALDVPRVAYTDTAFGVSPATLGAAGFGEVRNGVNTESNAHLGGGLRIWGSPVERLLFVLDAQRNDETDKFAPAITAQFRIFGGEPDGWALGVLARYKAEGFADLGGEMEGGILGSINRVGFHLDANLVAGADFDGGESDGEILARGGYDVLKYLRFGAESRVRYRLAGRAELPGNRNWDAFGGAQALAAADHYFGAVTGGPSTVGISDKLGWSVIASLGGVMF
ncbi:MAG TPA: hypothetical protein VK745_18410 [Polyangiaceae bacterium]|jgi:hypothetical protein|nr:hypothetical protein [Polyangiaceae bacterium]